MSSHSLLRVNQLLQFQTNIIEPRIVSELHPTPGEPIYANVYKGPAARKHSADECGGEHVHVTKPKTPSFIPLYHGKAAKSVTTIPANISSADIKKAVWMSGAGGKDVIYSNAPIKRFH